MYKHSNSRGTTRTPRKNAINRVFAFVMLCLLAPLATNAKNHNINSPDAWSNLIADPSILETDDVIMLSTSISGKLLDIPASVTGLTIEGNDRTLTAQIYASSDLTLTLKNITVSSVVGNTINTTASLTLATDGTVTITGSGSGGPAIWVGGDFTITGGSPAITHTADNYAAYVGGNLTISGSAAPTFNGGRGVRLSGNAVISTSGTTTFTNSSTTSGYPALHFYTSGATMTLNGSGAVNVTGAFRGILGGSLTIDGNGTGALNVTGGSGSGIYSSNTLTLSKTGGGISIAGTTGAALESTDINISGAAVTVSGTTNAISGSTGITSGSLTATGNLTGDLTVSGAGTTANVTGSIGGNLTVSDGTVTVSGTVSGTITVTGGTLVTAPDAPANVTATAGDGQATVTFDAPANNGATITGYTVTVNPADVSPVNGTSSPITVFGLANGTAYTFTVTVTNSVGESVPSGQSNSVTPLAPLTYTATIDPTSKIFAAATAGYGVQAEQQFTITNTGTGNLTNVQALLVSAPDFEISTALSAPTISTNSTATVSVRPRTGLGAGTHTGTLAIMGNNNLSITTSLSFTVNAPAYNITVGSFTGGSVVTNRTSATAGETVTLTVYPASGYELSAISVFKTGEASVSISLNGFNGLNGSFTMPAFDVTVSASFTEIPPPEPDPDAVALDAMIYSIRSLHVTVPQEEANTESDAVTWLRTYLARLFQDKGWDISVQTLTVVNFFPATAGTRTDMPGTNGSFSFFAILRKGYVTDRTYNMDGTIAATPYTIPTGNESAEVHTSAYLRNHTLYICSPVAETVEVYSFSGRRIFSAKKDAGEASFTVPTNLKAVIVRGSSGWTRKTIDN